MGLNLTASHIQIHYNMESKHFLFSQIRFDCSILFMVASGREASITLNLSTLHWQTHRHKLYGKSLVLTVFASKSVAANVFMSLSLMDEGPFSLVFG